MIVKFFTLMERGAAYLLGKGWGSSTVKKEFAAAESLLNVKKLSFCVDIGGSVGTYSEEIIKKYPNCRVVIFEPSQSNNKILNKKFSEFPMVTLEHSAVSNENGATTLYSNHDGSGLASLTKRRLDHFNIEFEYTESVKVIRFEDYWKEVLNSQPIDICKIDIEGHELDALRGFGDAINFISVIQFEFGGCNIDTRTFFQDFWYFFQDNDFDLYRISPIGVIHIPQYREIEEFFSTTNFLAKRRQ